MINKYEAYWRWEKNSDGTYFFDCCTGPYVQCSDCPFNSRPLPCNIIAQNVPTWNDVRKLMQKVYGVKAHCEGSNK